MRRFTKTGSHISTGIGKAIGDYNLIGKDDRILVAVSGGKDSLTLLKLLCERRKWSPVPYELIAVHIETDLRCGSCTHTDTLKSFFASVEVEGVFRKVSIQRNDRDPDCFWCSWNRRKALFDLARERGCNKIALGHHKDDIIETTLLNLFFHGEFSSMNPRQELFGGKVLIIRPLCYCEERFTAAFAKEQKFPSRLCACPYAQDSERKYVKSLIGDLEKRIPLIRTNLFNSPTRIKEDYLKF